MEREIQEFEAADAAKEHDLREKIRILQAKKIDIVAKREELQSKNYALRAAIKDQPCTYEIKKEILGDINELKRTIDAKKERLEFLQKIHSKYVGKLEEEITKVSIIDRIYFFYEHNCLDNLELLFFFNKISTAW